MHFVPQLDVSYHLAAPFLGYTHHARLIHNGRWQARSRLRVIIASQTPSPVGLLL